MAWRFFCSIRRSTRPFAFDDGVDAEEGGLARGDQCDFRHHLGTHQPARIARREDDPGGTGEMLRIDSTITDAPIHYSINLAKHRFSASFA